MVFGVPKEEFANIQLFDYASYIEEKEKER